MKLRGSLIEKSYAEQLLKSWNGMKERVGEVMPVLERTFPLINSAFVLAWTPEQFENIYTVLVNGQSVVSFEISKETHEVVNFECVDVKAYEKSIRSKANKIQLAVALSLAIEIMRTKK